MILVRLKFSSLPKPCPSRAINNRPNFGFDLNFIFAYTGDKVKLFYEEEKMMSKSKFYQILLLSLVILGMVFALSACSSTQPDTTADNANQEETATDETEAPAANKIFTFYNAVKLGQTKADVEKVLVVAPEVQSDGTSYFKDAATGYGVMVQYDDGDKVIVKGLIPPEGAAELVALNKTTVTADQVAGITPGMTYDEVKKILGGEGVEVIQGISLEDGTTNAYAMAWFNADLSTAVVYLNGPEGTVIEAEFSGV